MRVLHVMLGFFAGIMFTTLIYYLVLSGLSGVAEVLDNAYNIVNSNEYLKLQAASDTLSLLKLDINVLYSKYNDVAYALGPTTMLLAVASILGLAATAALTRKKSKNAAST